MNSPVRTDLVFERRLSARLIDVFIRACLILALAILCYDIFSPFVTLMAWALILAVSLYPAHQMFARRLGGRDGLAAILLVLIGIVLIVAPTTVLAMALGDSIESFVARLSDHSLQVPEPPASVAAWPVIGAKAHALWSQAHTDLPSLVMSLQPYLGDISKKALGAVAAIGGSVLLFLFSFAIAGVMMAYGQSGAAGIRAVFDRIVGLERGERFAQLCTSTIRAVAQGVLGVALIQAIVVGLLLLFAGIPFAARPGSDRARPRNRAAAGAARDPAGHRLHLVEPFLQHRRGGHAHGAARARGNARQHPQAAASRSRGRRADDGDPDRRARRHGDQRHPRHVPRRDPPRRRLQDLHGVGGRESGSRPAPRRGSRCWSRSLPEAMPLAGSGAGSLRDPATSARSRRPSAR